MKRTPFAVRRQVNLAINWYGAKYSFYRNVKNEYGEPVGDSKLVQTVDGVYHASYYGSIVELVNSDGTSVKSKINKGITCSGSANLALKQGDYVLINEVKYCITAVEPVFYSDEVVAYEISLEELVEGDD